MIFDRIAIAFRRVDNRDLQQAAVKRADRWSHAAQSDPALVEDIITMSDLLALSPRKKNQQLDATALDLAYDRGRQDLALEILANMKITQFELSQLMEKKPHEVI